MAIAQVTLQPNLIDQVHDRLLAAIVDGTLAAGQRVTQDSAAEMLGVSRQPVSHALQVLKRRGLLVEVGKRGLAVAPIDAERVRGLYQVRGALDGLAAELAAARIRAGRVVEADMSPLRNALASGRALRDDEPIGSFIEADVAFHSAIYRLSGNDAILDTVAEQWPHFMRSMGLVLLTSETRDRVWREHVEIAAAVLDGHASRAAQLAQGHATYSSAETIRRLELAEAAA